MWMRHIERSIWIEVGTGAAALNRAAYEWKWPGLGGAKRFVQLVGITGTGRLGAHVGRASGDQVLKHSYTCA